MILFSFSEYWWFYLGFILFVFVLLALDLGVFHRKAHEVGFKESMTWTAIWISLALLFNFGLYQYSLWLFSSDPQFLTRPDFVPSETARSIALEFLTGFVVEKTLAVDNIFIFAVVFSFFGVPKIYQHRILFWGVLGALVFRAIFIALGSVLMKYEAVVIFFGGLLILTGLKMFFAGTESKDLSENILIKWLRKLFRIHPKIEGPQFFIRKEGLLFVTPLFIALLFLEMTDIIFALDSVPAIFAITKEPLVVFTSNIFAILGLRSLYFVLIGVIDRFIYIKYGLAAVLVFVGLKMVYLNRLYDGHFPISWSLGIIASLILASIGVSLLVDKRRRDLTAS